MRMSLFVSVVLSAGIAAPALADLTGAPLTIRSVNAEGQTLGSLIIQESWAPWVNGVWSWQSSAPMSILSSTGAPLGVLESCALSFVQDPIVNINFTLTGGPAGSHFIISSGALSFPAMAGAIGDASAGYSLTDSDHVGGALTTGNYPGGKMYRAFYNGFPVGTTFAYLADGVAAPLNGTNGDFENQPPTPIPGVVTDMSAQWDFHISPNDSIGATSTFQIVPSPATGALLALGGLAALRRRR